MWESTSATSETRPIIRNVGAVCGAARTYLFCNDFRTRGPLACYECGYLDGRRDEKDARDIREDGDVDDLGMD